MKTTIYLDNSKFIAGITLKDKSEKEQNNMALHASVNQNDVLSNRLKLAQTIGCQLDDFICTNQTHSDYFFKATTSHRGKGAYDMQTCIANTDALYTFEPNLLLCSFSADCVPVIIYSEHHNVASVIHSGWQGTVKELTLKTLQHLIQVEQCQPNSLHIIIGPAISQSKFEVDEDVYTKFNNLGYATDYIYYNEQTRKYHIDNQLTVKKQCELAGIPSSQIMIDRTCTFISPDGFSYRQDKQCGRHLSFIMMKE